MWVAGNDQLYYVEKDSLLAKEYVFPENSVVLKDGVTGVCSCNEALMVWGHSQVLLFDGEHWEEFLNSN